MRNKDLDWHWIRFASDMFDIQIRCFGDFDMILDLHQKLTIPYDPM